MKERIKEVVGVIIAVAYLYFMIIVLWAIFG